MPGVRSPACSAIVQQFLRGSSASRPGANARARRRGSAPRLNRAPARVISSSNVPSQRPGSTLGPAAARRSSRVVTNQMIRQRPPRLPVPAPKINGPGGRQGCITSTRGLRSIRLPSHTQEHTCDEARSGGPSSTSDGLSCCCRKTSHPGSGRSRVVAPADTDFSGLGIEVAVGAPEGLPFEGVLRFAFPWPGFTPCTWLTTLSRDDLIERAGAVSTAKLSEIDDALRASEQRTEWTPAAAARLSEIKDSLRRRTQADGEGDGRPR